MLNFLPYYLNQEDSRRTVSKEIKSECDIPLHLTEYVYMHGDLEWQCGTDIGTFVNCPQVCKHTAFEYSDGHIAEGNRVFLDGIYDVYIMVEKVKARAYMWTRPARKQIINGKEYEQWEQYGLIVLPSDKESVKYAIEKYNNKSYTF
jgi:hypothetical protein